MAWFPLLKPVRSAFKPHRLVVRRSKRFPGSYSMQQWQQSCSRPKVIHTRNFLCVTALYGFFTFVRLEIAPTNPGQFSRFVSPGLNISLVFHDSKPLIRLSKVLLTPQTIQDRHLSVRRAHSQSLDISSNVSVQDILTAPRHTAPIGLCKPKRSWARSFFLVKHLTYLLQDLTLVAVRKQVYH